eukprot:283027_1
MGSCVTTTETEKNSDNTEESDLHIAPNDNTFYDENSDNTDEFESDTGLLHIALNTRRRKKKDVQLNQLIERIDNGLRNYYEQLNRNDYTNSRGIGKFVQYLDNYKNVSHRSTSRDPVQGIFKGRRHSLSVGISFFSEKKIRYELARDPKDCILLDFDMDYNGNNMFPLSPSINDKYAKRKEIHRIIIDISIKGAALTWTQISEAMKHELYDEMSSSFIKIMIKNTFTINKQNTPAILIALQKSRKMGVNERNYVKCFLERAINFQPVRKNTFEMLGNVYDTDGNDEKKNEEELSLDGLTVNTLCDIYSVYSTFLFSNYQRIQYEKDAFIDDIKRNDYFQHNKITIPHVRATSIENISLCPQYIIDDDMYGIFKHFFAASRLIDILVTTS